MKVVVNLRDKARRKKGKPRRKRVEREVRIGDPIGVPHRFLSGDASAAARGFNVYQDLARNEADRLARRDMLLDARHRDLDTQRRNNEAAARMTQRITEGLARATNLFADQVAERFRPPPTAPPLGAGTFAGNRVAPPVVPARNTSIPTIYRPPSRSRQDPFSPDFEGADEHKGELSSISSRSDSSQGEDDDMFQVSFGGGKSPMLSRGEDSIIDVGERTPSPPPLNQSALNISGSSIRPSPLPQTDFDARLASANRMFGQINREFATLTGMPATGLYSGTPISTSMRSLGIYTTPPRPGRGGGGGAGSPRGGAASPRSPVIDAQYMLDRLATQGSALTTIQKGRVAQYRANADDLSRHQQNDIRMMYNSIFGRKKKA